MLSEIIDSLKQLHRGTLKEKERIDLNTPLIDLGFTESEIILALKAVEIATRRKMNIQQTGHTISQLSQMTVMRLLPFCEEHMRPNRPHEINTAKPKKKWLFF